MYKLPLKRVNLEFLLTLIFVPSVIWIFFSDRIILKYDQKISIKQLVEIDGFQDAIFVTILSIVIVLIIRLFRKQLFEREQFLSSLVDSQTNFLIRLTTDGRLTYVNKSFQHKFNYVTKNFIGTIFFISPWIENSKGLDAIDECIKNPDTIVSVSTEIRKDNSAYPCYVQWQMKAILNKKRIPSQIQAVGFDVTPLELQAQKINKQNQHLKEITFFSSHLIRAPLTEILGLTALLDKNNLPSENLEIVDNIKISAQRLDDVILDIVKKSDSAES